MSEAKHTPGPWRYWSCRIDSITGMEDYLQFANLQGYVFRAPISHMMEPDARLIAAAPELLDALRSIVKSLVDQDDEGMIEHAGPMMAARAAIAKATGQKQ